MQFSKKSPIGIFDSGVGGLTVYKEIRQLLPQEDLIYLGDTARVPYGTKSREVILKYALQNSLFLLDHHVKLIVIACNTASAFALSYLQERLKVPVIGVIEPGAEAALEKTQNKRVGIIGTEGTIRSQAYEKALQKRDATIKCVSHATSLFVPIIEEGLFSSKILEPVFDHYLKDFIQNKIDTLILGCTHYPLIYDFLQKYFSGQVHLVDSAKTTAQIVKQILQKEDLLFLGTKKKAQQKIIVTDAPERVRKIACRFLEQDEITIQTTTIY